MSLKVLFLCTGNSCRSQIAEALVNHKLTGSWQAYSAGTAPVGYTHPKAIQVLEEIGIEHVGESKHVDRFIDQDFDLVITVCDSAAETCPTWLGSGLVRHHSFPDPAKVAGSDEKITHAFREVRDRMMTTIFAELQQASQAGERKIP
jgi:arsenate reductase